MGLVLMRPYPWIPTPLATRSSDDIASANARLRMCSNVLEIRKQVGQGTRGESYGMFARRRIKKGEHVLDSRTAVSISTAQMTGECFNCYISLEPSSTSADGGEKCGFACCPRLRFCSQTCKDIAEEHYHQAQCGKGVESFYDDAKGKDCFPGGPESSNLIWLRMLTICAQQKNYHPLKNPAFATLLAGSTDEPLPWNLESHVMGPIRILQKLGIDIFADQNYESWVLETLWFVDPLLLFRSRIDHFNEGNARRIIPQVVDLMRLWSVCL